MAKTIRINEELSQAIEIAQRHFYDASKLDTVSLAINLLLKEIERRKLVEGQSIKEF